ncbi:uncharacterized protein RSE6_04544 [Rhynchosporium secalis]|uniref:Uncharacterized protein n=1 Tax=Rhynchosporium secalis TaxID=38038 RepID=A0A1E1M5J9_RHYSE|nr:uncharacterized protein RSE6_04544 [Rhynchosporium secalis]
MSLLLRPTADALNGVSSGKENKAFRDAKMNKTVFLVQVEPLQIQPHSRPIFEFPPAPRVKFPQIESRRIDRSQDEKTPASMKRKRELPESLSRSGLKIRTYPQSHTNPLKDPGHASQQADSSTTTSKSTATLQPSTPPLNINRNQEAPASNTLLPTSPRAESLKHLREAEPYRADAAYREISEASDDEE